MKTNHWTILAILFTPFAYLLSAMTSNDGLNDTDVRVISAGLIAAALYWFFHIRRKKNTENQDSDKEES
jgi:hypothetical protein